MKVSFLSSLSLLIGSLVSAESPNQIDDETPIIVTDPDFVPTPEKPFNFHIDYTISFKEDIESGIILDIFNGETIELAYTFSSLEPTEVSIVGLGGELLDPITGENMANITASQIGPVNVLNNQTTNFTQRVGINLEDGQYLLVPAIYIVYQDQFMMLGSKNKIINVIEPSISIFNPQLIISELILLASFAAIIYYIYITFAAKYLSGILPSSLLPTDKKSKKYSSSSNSSSNSSTTASASSSNVHSDSWLPDSHKKLSKKQKKKL